MDTVTVSSKYQVVIPKDVRDRIDLRAGEKLNVSALDDRIVLIRTRRLSTIRGSLRGLDPTFVRDEEDRA